MEVVLDSVCLNHLLRHPKRKVRAKHVVYGTALDEYIERKTVRIALDPDRGIADEWQRSCDADAVKALIVQWEARSGLFNVDKLGHLNARQNKFLRVHGLTKPIDKIVLKTAMVTRDKVLVSEDTEFWDRNRKSSRGDANACVARFCREEWLVTILLLGMLMSRLAAK